MKILVTGGAGFIGTSVVRYLLDETSYSVVNVDKLTYSGCQESTLGAGPTDRYSFEQADICDMALMRSIFTEHRPACVLHLAAESHVDRSIESPDVFMQTNVLGTYNLLEVSREYYLKLSDEERKSFRFHHVSTDEVFGDLNGAIESANERSSYFPSSPYSASKASADCLVKAWGRTYNLPTLITNSSNNYGPYQFPEKLVPRTIINALEGKSLQLYGDGKQIRDWIHVDDHARALTRVLVAGEVGEMYNIGGGNQKRNKDVIFEICGILEELAPQKPKGVKEYSELIRHVTDRPGHDIRYSIDSSKITHELGWEPKIKFSAGLRQTVLWYLSNREWWDRALSKKARDTKIRHVKWHRHTKA